LVIELAPVTLGALQGIEVRVCRPEKRGG